MRREFVKESQDKKTTTLSAKVRSATAIVPDKGVQIRKFPDINDAEKNPTSPLASMFGRASLRTGCPPEPR